MEDKNNNCRFIVSQWHNNKEKVLYFQKHIHCISLFNLKVVQFKNELRILAKRIETLSMYACLENNFKSNRSLNKNSYFFLVYLKCIPFKKSGKP